MFIRTTDKETGQLLIINMDHIESIVDVSDEEDFCTELRIHGNNSTCYRVLESAETIYNMVMPNRML